MASLILGVSEKPHARVQASLFHMRFLFFFFCIGPYFWDLAILGLLSSMTGELGVLFLPRFLFIEIASP